MIVVYRAGEYIAENQTIYGKIGRKGKGLCTLN